MKYEFSEQDVKTIIAGLDIMAKLSPLQNAFAVGSVLNSLNNPIQETPSDPVAEAPTA